MQQSPLTDAAHEKSTMALQLAVPVSIKRRGNSRQWITFVMIASLSILCSIFGAWNGDGRNIPGLSHWHKENPDDCPSIDLVPAEGCLAEGSNGTCEYHTWGHATDQCPLLVRRISNEPPFAASISNKKCFKTTPSRETQQRHDAMVDTVARSVCAEVS